MARKLEALGRAVESAFSFRGRPDRLALGTDPSTVSEGRPEESADPDSLRQRLERARAAWMHEMRPFSDAFGCVRFPLAPQLAERHLEHARVLPDREHILKKMTSGGIAAEVGVQTGRFSRAIIDLCRPAKLHLVDRDLRAFSIAEQFRSDVDAGTVCLHEGDSSSVLRGFPEAYFDFVYVDADHTYAGVKRDIEAAKSKVKESGCLVFNDYTFWSPAECMPYGVVQAVNELCIEDDWEVLYLALAHYMYCDVAVRRRLVNVEPRNGEFRK